MRRGFQLAGVGCVIGWSKYRLGTPYMHWIRVSSNALPDRWEFPMFYTGHWQSPCIALTAGKSLPLGLSKETAKEYRDQSRYAPSQWETLLHCNDVSHWLGAYLYWFLVYPGNDITLLFVNVHSVQSCKCMSTVSGVSSIFYQHTRHGASDPHFFQCFLPHISIKSIRLW